MLSRTMLKSCTIRAGPRATRIIDFGERISDSRFAPYAYPMPRRAHTPARVHKLVPHATLRSAPRANAFFEPCAEASSRPSISQCGTVYLAVWHGLISTSSTAAIITAPSIIATSGYTAAFAPAPHSVKGLLPYGCAGRGSRL